jgi:hypothetical protein
VGVRHILEPKVDHVYFVHCETCGLVKIGFSCNPEHRINAVVRAHREELGQRVRRCYQVKPTKKYHTRLILSSCEMAVLGCVVGGRPEERELHRTFAAYRAPGTEWFSLPPDLFAVVRRLARAGDWVRAEITDHLLRGGM